MLLSCPHPPITIPQRAVASPTVSRLTDTTKFTGSHKERFDETGRGKGKAGRVDMVDTSGYVSGYKHAGSYEKKVKPGPKQMWQRSEWPDRDRHLPMVLMFQKLLQKHKNRTGLNSLTYFFQWKIWVSSFFLSVRTGIQFTEAGTDRQHGLLTFLSKGTFPARFQTDGGEKRDSRLINR